MAAVSPPAAAEPPKAQFKAGDRLVLAAPGHTGLPNGGNVTVRSAKYDAEAGWLYDVMLKNMVRREEKRLERMDSELGRKRRELEELTALTEGAQEVPAQAARVLLGVASRMPCL